jgi:hypothetical protein
MFAELAIALERTERDVLGPISAALCMTSYRRGQFWTPWEVSLMMAKITLHDSDALLRQNGFPTVSEPACGPGGMAPAFAQAMREAGHNPQRRLHVTAIDIAPWCVHMCFTQLALMHIPAVVVVGDAVRGTSNEQWFTPAHILGGFSRRLRERETAAGRVREPPGLTEPAAAARDLLDQVIQPVVPAAPEAPEPAPAPSLEVAEPPPVLGTIQLKRFPRRPYDTILQSPPYPYAGRLPRDPRGAESRLY